DGYRPEGGCATSPRSKAGSRKCGGGFGRVSYAAAPEVDDARGRLLKAWPRPVEGEVYVVELRPGHPRGHHLHRRGGEWFVPLSGRATLVVEQPETGDRAVVSLDRVRARVEPGQAHALFASGDESAWVLAIADVPWDQEETIPSPVQEPC
ncbi:MAG: WxcM-like domain-containing protein, partial [Myxococcota bacterium]|nr:WxcM-like domain-containing protein [Myxococcota bacterium]